MKSVAKRLGLCLAGAVVLAVLVVPHGCSREPHVQQLPLGKTINVKPASVNGHSVENGFGLADTSMPTPKAVVYFVSAGDELEPLGYDEDPKEQTALFELYDINNNLLYSVHWDDIKKQYKGCNDPSYVDFVALPGEQLTCDATALANVYKVHHAVAHFPSGSKKLSPYVFRTPKKANGEVVVLGLMFQY